MNTRHRLFIGSLLVVALALAMAIPAKAITYGTPDNGEHPYVVMLLFYNEGGEAIWRCSGSLLSENLILTAGHCVDTIYGVGTPASVRVYTDEFIAFDPFSNTYPEGGYYSETLIPHPNWDWWLPFPETYDIGVVILDEPITGITEFATLPELNFLDQIAAGKQQDIILTSVGYGLNDLSPTEIWYHSRYMAQSFVINLDNWIADGWNIQFSGNPGLWVDSEDFFTGGVCSGDSGGATLYGGPDSNLIVGVIQASNSYYCHGWSLSWRVDIAPSLDFLNQVMTEYGIVLPDPPSP